MKKSKILFQITGSIAAFKSASVVSDLVKSGHEVKVVFSESASRFVGASTFEGLTGHAVYSNMFGSKEPMAHIDLARWADVMVLCPASANSLAQLAHGFAQDLIGTLFLAKESHIPYLIFPAMNPQMWAAPLVQRNCNTLSTLPNVHVLKPASGSMACGEFGEGRLLEPEEILKYIESFLTASSSSKESPVGSVLITGGGTSEPIDSVRSIANFSTGKTSVGLAEHLQRQGFQVDLLLAKTAASFPNSKINVTSFMTHQDLESELKSQLSNKNYAAIIHLAAVSDYTVKNKTDGKISSEHSNLTLELVPTKKLVRSLKEWSLNKNTKVIAFKLTSGASEDSRREQALSILEKNQLDAVVSNDLSEMNEKHPGELITKTNQRVSFQTKNELYQTLEKFLKEEL